MASVQRKLVHKQFNSPMGLYSQQNVKETLDRELKAFGSDGIEIDEQIAKPLNLANSAVLRAVEEEEQIKCERIPCERQSRSRQRYIYNRPHTPLHQQQLEQIKTCYLSQQNEITIDRDTVLKINRLATRRNLHKRDHSWPPQGKTLQYAQCYEQDRRKEARYYANFGDGEGANDSDGEGRGGVHVRSTSNDNVIHFDEIVCKRHGIDAIREIFNSPTRIIEPTAREVRQHRKMAKLKLQQDQQQNVSNKSMTNIKSANVKTPRVTNVSHNKQNTSSSTTKAPVPTSASVLDKKTYKINDGHLLTDNIGIDIATAAADVAVIEPTIIISANTPMAKGFSAPETRAADEDIGLVEPRRQFYEYLADSAKRWHSYDNLQQLDSKQPQQQQQQQGSTIAPNKRLSYSLERGRDKQRRQQQLPPLKPRAALSSMPGNSSSSSNLSKSSPKLQRRSIKLATEIKICYDNDANPTATITGLAEPSVTTNLATTAAKLAAATKCHAAIPQIAQNNYTATTVATNVNKQQELNDSSDLEHIPLPRLPLTAAAATATATTAAAAQILPTPLARTSQMTKPHKYVDSSSSSGNNSGSNISTTLLTGKIQDQVAATIPSNKSTILPQYSYNNKTNNLAADNTRIIPVNCEQRNDNVSTNAKTRDKLPTSLDYTPTVKDRQRQQQQRLRERLQEVSAQQIYDDACIYLRSIDLEDNTVAYIPAAITIVPSPTDEIMQQWTEATNLKASIQEVPATRQPPMAESTKEPAMATDLSRLPQEQPTYVTRLACGAHESGIQLKRQLSVGKRAHASEEALPVYATTPTTPAPPAITATSTKKAENPFQKSQEQQQASKKQRQGLYYTDGEFLYGPFESDELERFTKSIESKRSRATTTSTSQIKSEIASKIDVAKETTTTATTATTDAKQKQIAQLKRTQASVTETALQAEQLQQANKIEITKLEAKYGELQQSIAEHLKQIDAYMANAKTALNRCLQPTQNNQQPEELTKEGEKAQANDVDEELLQLLTAAARQSPILVVDTPMQVLLKQMQRKTAAASQSTTESEETILTRAAVENLPIVEQALLELTQLAQTIKHYETLKQTKQEQLLTSKAATTAAQYDETALKVEDESTLTPQLEHYVPLPTTVLTLKHGFVPRANRPIPVTIEDIVVDDERNTKTKLQLPRKLVDIAECNEQIAIDEYKLEHVADVVANFEQLCETQRQQQQQSPKQARKLLDKPSEIVKGLATTTSAFTASTTDESNKNIVTDFIATRQSQQQLIEQVIDIRHAEQQQEQSHSSSIHKTDLQQERSKQSLELNKQKEVTILTPTTKTAATTHTPQEHIISASTAASKTTSKQVAETQVTTATTTMMTANKSLMKRDVATATSTVDVDEHKMQATTEMTADENVNKIAAASVKIADDKQFQKTAISSSKLTTHSETAEISSSSSTSTSSTSRRQHLQQHFKNLHLNINQANTNTNNNNNNNFDTYKATYEIPSPYISRQISWEDTLDKFTTASATTAAAETLTTTEAATAAGKDKQMSEIQIEHAIVMSAAATQTQPQPPIPIPTLTPTPTTIAASNELTTTAKAPSTPTTPPTPPSLFNRPIHATPTTKSNAIRQAFDELYFRKRTCTCDQYHHEHGEHEHQLHPAHLSEEQKAEQAKLEAVEQEEPLTEQETTSNEEQTMLGLSAISKLQNESVKSNELTEMAIREELLQEKRATPEPPTPPPPPPPPPPATPIRKYPAPLIEPNVPTRSASPFGLNVLDYDIGSLQSIPLQHTQLGMTHKRAHSESPTPHEATAGPGAGKYAYVPQVEGHNVGLLVNSTLTPPAPVLAHSRSVSPYPGIIKTDYYVDNVPADETDADVDVDVNAVVDTDADAELQHFNSIAGTYNEYVTNRATASPTPIPTPRTASSSSGAAVRARNVKSIEMPASKVRSLSQPPPFEYLMQHCMPTAIATDTVTDSAAIVAAPAAATNSTKLDLPISSSAPATATSTASLLADDDSISNVAPVQNYFATVSATDHLRWQQQQRQRQREQEQTHYSTSREGSVINRSFDNVSPRPYITIEGYKRVAWPPASEERIVREFTPQPQGQQFGQQQQAPPSSSAQHQPHYNQQPSAAAPTQQQYGAPSYNNYQQPPYQQPQQQQQYPSPQPQYNHQPQYQPNQPQSQYQQPTQQQQFGQQQQQPHWAQQQHQQQPPQQYQSQPQYQPQYQQQPQQQYQAPSNYQNQPPSHIQPPQNQSNCYNSYSQPPQQQQQQHYPTSQDQPDYLQRGTSPGIITLRKEAPVSQQPAPVITSQPAAVSFQGGSNMRGDLKWPPPEYKEAAVVENELRRQLALGPVCRPRKVKRDYTQFFAKNALSNGYPSYKVPPGTQHMIA